MQEPLKYSKESMQQALESASAHTNKYSEAIAALDEGIEKLSNSWISKEDGTYEAFLQNYNANKQALFDARDYMIKFCVALQDKINTFDETATSVKNSFM